MSYGSYVLLRHGGFFADLGLLPNLDSSLHQQVRNIPPLKIFHMYRFELYEKSWRSKTELSLVYPSINYLKGRKDLKVSYCVINILTGEIDELKSICLIFAKAIPKIYSVQDSLRGNSSVRWGTWANAGCPRNWNYDSIRGKYIKYSITESWRVVTKTDLWTRPVNPEDFSGLPGLVPNKSKNEQSLNVESLL